jgi:hypothetical protein
VVQGTAPLDFWPHTSMLRQKKMPKQTPGKSKAVWIVVFFHSSPWRNVGRKVRLGMSGSVWLVLGLDLAGRRFGGEDSSELKDKPEVARSVNCR